MNDDDLIAREDGSFCTVDDYRRELARSDAERTAARIAAKTRVALGINQRRRDKG